MKPRYPIVLLILMLACLALVVYTLGAHGSAPTAFWLFLLISSNAFSLSRARYDARKEAMRQPKQDDAFPSNR